MEPTCPLYEILIEFLIYKESMIQNNIYTSKFDVEKIAIIN